VLFRSRSKKRKSAEELLKMIPPKEVESKIRIILTKFTDLFGIPHQGNLVIDTEFTYSLYLI
jgi:hypothetical protein